MNKIEYTCLAYIIANPPPSAKDGLLKLPKDLLVKIFFLLDAEDFLSLRLSCRVLREISFTPNGIGELPCAANILWSLFRRIIKTDTTQQALCIIQDPRVDPSAMNDYAIKEASRNGHTDIVKELVKDTRVNPSAENDYAIRMASRNGHTDIVNELLKDTRVTTPQQI